jgi:mono/diheme cytochrome c family protein
MLRHISMNTLKTLALFVVAAILVLALAVYSGAFDVAADSPHTPAVSQLLETLRDRSITVRSAAIQVPPLSDPGMIAEGAEHYSAMCSGCHLAPGARDSEIRPGLNPQPPDLTHSPPPAPARAFWVIKHGIKMTAMPAWGTTHSDAAIWNIVAFLQKLPAMTPEQFRSLAGESAGGDHDADETADAHTAESHTEHD